MYIHVFLQSQPFIKALPLTALTMPARDHSEGSSLFCKAEEYRFWRFGEASRLFCPALVPLVVMDGLQPVRRLPRIVLSYPWTNDVLILNKYQINI